MKRYILMMNLVMTMLILCVTGAHALECMAGEICNGKDTHMNCNSNATCYGVRSTMECSSGAQCYGLWSKMSCNSGAECYSIGTSRQKPTCNITSGRCRLIDITKQDTQKNLFEKINAIGREVNPSPGLCILSYIKDRYPFGCFWPPNRVDVRKATELMSSAFHVSHFKCSLRKDEGNKVVCFDDDIRDVLNLTVKLI